mgnify:CR=1 FL=1
MINHLNSTHFAPWANQSFDDSFVFQGKRQTGGNNRQKEIPQYTLVGNAVPPLMARAIANTLLQHIK